MEKQNAPKHDLIWFLQERAKELGCLYRIEELLKKPDARIQDVCHGIVEAIPPGWQYPDICIAQVTLEGKSYAATGFRETPWVQSARIIVQDENVGTISVYYTSEMPVADEGPFLKEETKLLNTIADRLGHFLMYRRMRHVFHEYHTAREELAQQKTPEWKVALNLLRETDHNLFLNVSRRMLNSLCWTGIKEAEELLERASTAPTERDDGTAGDENRPYRKNVLILTDPLSDEIFAIAGRHLTNDQLLSCIQKWIQEERLGFLAKLVNQNLSFGSVAAALRRYHHMSPEGIEPPPAIKRGVQVALIRRFLSDQPQFIANAIGFVEIPDFFDILDHILFLPDSHGRLGGKSAGLFLAEQILKKAGTNSELLAKIKVPRTWYITSDGLLNFLNYNNLNEVVEQKYKDIDQVRLEYPHIIQTFKNSDFSTEVIQGLSLVLDDFEDSPVIVRSSSLLEDRMGSSFSGKYKSLFLANQGSKQERLEALTDAIAEVYASVFSPDPISYRAERGLLHVVEEMGIMIEKVVGTRVGRYFVPSFAGVAFSRNEFRWSPRIEAQDGLIRLVPGLGTRAVDRTSDDYPILVAPGKPGLRVNVTVDEVVRYSPRRIDVINVETNKFETIDIRDFLREAGQEVPGIERMVSVYDGNQMRKPVGKSIDFERGDLVTTFEGLVHDTDFVRQVSALLKLLQDELKMPVDIEFASDGKDLYLLQCRPQSYVEGGGPSPIPRDVPRDNIVFTANRYVTNGRVPDITHIVYVHPKGYDDIANLSGLVNVGRAVGRLNKMLPRRKFILMGPGRWGSRGDIKLGVRVSYADISNTALLVEIARKKGNYVPDLSFGTHFFQDLVEADIRYLPLYPDDDGTVFKESFLTGSANILPDVLPEFANLADIVRLIDVPRATGGRILRVLMNADLDEAVAFLADPSAGQRSADLSPGLDSTQSENFWAWRLQMAEHIASRLDGYRFGVKGFYVFGSTKNATAGPGSDIDVLIHFVGTEQQRAELLLWLSGWSSALAEMNYLRTGYKSDGLLDVHIVTDEDIARQTSYAAKIGAITDPARPLSLKGSQSAA